jgi:hypothetical protein
MPALWTFRHPALHRRWTATASESSAIRYVKGETAFWTIHKALRLLAHFGSLSSSHPSIEILKVFGKGLNELMPKFYQPSEQLYIYTQIILNRLNSTYSLGSECRRQAK